MSEKERAVKEKGFLVKIRSEKRLIVRRNRSEGIW